MTSFVDPVCGMPVDEIGGVKAEREGLVRRFCSEFCRDQFLSAPSRYLERSPDDPARRRIAYLSMEIAFDGRVPTYCGGLGVLAGDVLRSCADLQMPVVGVTLVSRQGYFRQEIDPAGRQRELAAPWVPDGRLLEAPARVRVEIEGRLVEVRAWRVEIRGATGGTVPLLLLDTALPQNSAWDRRITDSLYGGDVWYRLAQEVVLGTGGLRMLRALGYTGLRKFHLNEGHAALAAWELLRECGTEAGPDFSRARQHCVFTTHTPVVAGRDRFEWPAVRRMLGPGERYEILRMLGGRDALDMTRLALNLSSYANGVAIRHQQVSEEMFPGYSIRHVTNGVHSRTWTAPPLARILDRFLPSWRADPALLRQAYLLPDEDLLRAHAAAKAELVSFVEQRTGKRLAPAALTIGFARRAALYKRTDLVLSDLERLRAVARRAGPLQLVFAGKAHPHDEPAKDLIARVIDRLRALGADVPSVYLSDYDMEAAKLLVAGCDVWLNTPQPPLEASGTSGMKAAHNGVPSLSTLDGWWLEGHLEGLTGWSAGDAEEIYDKLEHSVLPAFLDPARWAGIMKHCIAINASFFNTHRVVQQYATAAYLLP
jgi:starch phosphorylase